MCGEEIRSCSLVVVLVEDKEQESFDLDPKDYLLGQAHYDPEDNGVFKSVKIVAEDFGNGAEVVVYRSHYNSSSGK